MKQVCVFILLFLSVAFGSYSGKCGDDCNWELNERGTLFIKWSGEMENYSYSSVPWLSQRGSIKRIQISAGIASIGNWVFTKCYSLTSIIIPNSVRSIRESAFYKCSSLRSVTIPKRFESQKDDIFDGCKKLKNINWV